MSQPAPVAATPIQAQQKAAPASASHSGLLQRKCACGQHTVAGGECEECRKKREGMLQRAAINAAPTNGVPPIVHDVLSAPGQPLDAGTRAFMEPRFGFDFSRVRVHTDARAAGSAQAVNALAYTVGHNVVFGTGQYAPGTNEGRRLLAHELTHVVQQRDGSAVIQSQLRVNSVTDPAEFEADRMAYQLLAGNGHTKQGKVPVSKTPVVLGRAPAPNTAKTPQKVGETISIEIPDTKTHIERTLVHCPCRKVPEPLTGIFYNPDPNNPLLLYDYCNGRVTLRVYGGAENLGGLLSGQQSQQPTKVRAGVEVNISETEKAKLGLLGNVDAVFTTEQGGGVGPSAKLAIEKGQWRLFVEPEYIRQLQASTGTTQNKLNIVFGGAYGRFSLQVNTQDLLGKPGVTATIGTDLGPHVRKEDCFTCVCPPPVPVYACWEPKSPPPPEQEPEQPSAEPEKKEFRYYFVVDKDILEEQSADNFKRLKEELRDRATVDRIAGYASPEDTEQHNQDLSKRRAEAMRKKLEQFLKDVGRVGEHLPDIEFGGESLGRFPGKGKHLGDLPVEASGKTAEEVTKVFLPHGRHISGRDLLEIADKNKDLSDEFTYLFTHFAETKKKRLALFGLEDDGSPASQDILAAIEIFLHRTGEGTPPAPRKVISKELDEVFRFLRVGIITITKAPKMSLHMREQKPQQPELDIEKLRTYLDAKKCEELGKAHADEFGPIDRTVDSSTRDQECQEKPGKSELSLGCKYDIPPTTQGTLTPPANAPERLK